MIRRIFESEKFDGVDDRDSGTLIEGLEFRKCHFEDCLISMTGRPELWSIIRDVRLISCSARANCDIGTAQVEDVVIEDFKKVGGNLIFFGAVYKHVVLRGRIDDFISNHFTCHDLNSLDPRADEEAFAAVNANYYETVDWALDISEASFRAPSIRNVPARLIRRDSETQAIVTREKALEGKWRDLPLRSGLFRFTISYLIKFSENPDTILIAGKRDRDFDDLVHDLKLLRDAGVAELD